ncbi:hypothetical protein BD779DRAFT_1440530 [Infundibulicybe gibba]|nr:hypothetical protein BD779DRAFT_1440530 [Infundibulicybe gibba]
MVKINTIDISPPLVNSSCAWSSDLKQLEELYTSPFTGAVTTRTATADGFVENNTHTVAFSNSGVSSINSYGYSPHPLAQYLGWIEDILTNHPGVQKPFIVSITASDPATLKSMVASIQSFRARIGDSGTQPCRIAIEVNTSCPNIPGSSPSGYAIQSLIPLLTTLAEAHSEDDTLTIGLKLPPFVYKEQFTELFGAVSRIAAKSTPFTFFTCTNTLGNSLLFSDQTSDPAGIQSDYAVPTVLGGMAGDALHPLSLGNVYTFAQLIANSPDPEIRKIKIIGVGGVTLPAAAKRMKRAGAAVVGCATLFGQEGIKAFEILSRKSDRTFLG